MSVETTTLTAVPIEPGPWDIYYQRVMRLAEDSTGIQMLFTIKQNLAKVEQTHANYLGPHKDLYIQAYIKDHT